MLTDEADVCVVGRFPPPLGGVSVYCSRRYAFLRGQSAGTRKIDFSNRAWIIQLILSRDVRYEINTLNLWIVFLLVLLGKMKKSVLVDHNASRHYKGRRKGILLWLLRGAMRIDVVNRKLLDFYPGTFSTAVVSPFLPPDETELNQILATYSTDVRAFLDNAPFFVNSAWRYTAHKNSDLYGLESSIRLLESLPAMKLLLAIGDSSSIPLHIMSAAQRFMDSGRLCLLKGQKQLWPVFTKNAICLRLTPTDGDSVTVKEALHFGCPVLASDAIERPAECHLYRYGDFDDLSMRAREILDTYQPQP